MSKSVCAIAAATFLTVGLTSVLHASENWPDRPVTMIVPFATGGSTDYAARLLAQGLTARLGQNVLVENRPGASGSLGAGVVANADSDGYTLLFGSSGVLAANIHLFDDLPYHPVDSYEPLGRVSYIVNVLAVHPSVEAETVEEFVDYVAARPDQINYGSAGIATIQHVAAAYFARQKGLDMQHVPYSGGAPAVLDLVGGQIDALFAPIVEIKQHIDAGAVRALGVTSDERTLALPDVPPIADVVPGYNIQAWHAVMAPAGTTPEVVAKIEAALEEIVQTEEIRNAFADLGMVASFTNSADFGAFQDAQIKLWAELIELAQAESE